MSMSPFHAGEQQVQAKLGVRETIEPWARRVVRNFLTAEHRAFYPQLPFLVAAARDGRGRPWATLLTGAPGFVRVPDESSLLLQSTIAPGDALAGSLVAGADLGLLGIEFETRRRNRVNGTITAAGAQGLRLEVRQAFGNCPQYITERSWYEVDVGEGSGKSERTDRLDADMQRWIAAADTFFMASGYSGDGNDEDSDESFGMDASHRGGSPGFVRMENDRRLVFPDYAGNNHFNTIGNLIMDPRAGLLFVDFEEGSLLQVTGHATVDFDSDEVRTYSGAQRLIIIDIDEIVRLDAILPVRWTAPSGSVRQLRVVEKLRESEDVVSLEFVARDGAELPDFEAGQHLPIELEIEGEPEPVVRTYSLSNAPGSGRYRISVKRERPGVVSNLLHDVVGEGAVINARIPSGDFRLGYSTRPVVLISAGIGVTPMVSMLHRIVADGSQRRVTFLQSVRDGAHHAFADEVRDIACSHSNVTVGIAYSRPRPEDRAGRQFDHAGRIDAEFVGKYVTEPDADVYLCGPGGFMAAMFNTLETLGVDAGRIHTETFGPSSAKRTEINNQGVTRQVTER